MALEDLNHRQRLFVEAYLGDAAGNASEAARIAGYAHPGQVGERLLKKVEIRSAIDARLAQAAMGANEVLARLSAMAAGDLSDFIKVDADGEPSLDLAKARRRKKLGLVKKLTPTKFGWSIEMYDAMAALEKLGRYHGLFTEKPVDPKEPGKQAVTLYIPDNGRDRRE